MYGNEDLKQAVLLAIAYGPNKRIQNARAFRMALEQSGTKTDRSVSTLRDLKLIRESEVITTLEKEKELNRMEHKNISPSSKKKNWLIPAVLLSIVTVAGIVALVTKSLKTDSQLNLAAVEYEETVQKNEELVRENEELIRENEELVQENEELVRENEELARKNEELVQEEQVVSENEVTLVFNEFFLDFKGMTYGQYKKNTGKEAEWMRGEMHEAELSGNRLSIVFESSPPTLIGDAIDYRLYDEDKSHRVQGIVRDFLIEKDADMIDGIHFLDLAEHCINNVRLIEVQVGNYASSYTMSDYYVVYLFEFDDNERTQVELHVDMTDARDGIIRSDAMAWVVFLYDE